MEHSTYFRDKFFFFNQILIESIKNEFPDLSKYALDRIVQINEYNIIGGKLNRGLMVMEAYSQYCKEFPEFSGNILDAACLGWCIEWLQAFFLVADDIMDESLTRRNKPCWFRNPEVGLVAFNDALILKSSINLLLKNQFQSSGLYFRLSELFREVELATEMGQMLDLTTKNVFKLSPEDLVLRYNQIVKYKTAFYSFYLPFACAYHLTHPEKINANMCIEEEKSILLEIGNLFQVQDDFLDTFGDSMTTGKVGTDIAEGKCTWLLCKFLSLNPQNQDRQYFIENYGKKGSEEGIRTLYCKYNLPEIFNSFESNSRVKIQNSIHTLSSRSSQKILSTFLTLIEKRIK